MPFHAAVAPFVKLVPIIVRVKAAPPATVEAGLRLLMAGGGGPLPTTEAGSIVKVAALELPSEVVTVMPVDPAVAMRLAGIAAVICEVERKVVEREVAPQWTVDEDVKLTPLMVSVKAAEPATISPGLRLLMVGVAAKTGKAESAASVAGKVAANHRARRGIFRMLSPSQRY